MNPFKSLYLLYKEGLKNQSKLGRKLWILVAIKLFIMFAILKVFFFPNFLKDNFETDEEKSNHIINVLTNQK